MDLARSASLPNFDPARGERLRIPRNHGGPLFADPSVSPNIPRHSGLGIRPSLTSSERRDPTCISLLRVRLPQFGPA